MGGVGVTPALVDILVVLAVRASREAERNERAIETDGEEVNEVDQKEAALWLRMHWQ